MKIKIFYLFFLFFSITSVSVAQTNLTLPKDIETSYAKDRIEALYELGYLKGYDNGTFRPFDSITRAEFAVMLANTLEMELNPNASAHFTDIPIWAEGHIGALFENGLSNGISSTQFGSNRLITRQEMTTILIRTLQLDDYILALDLPNIFQDKNLILNWAKPYVDFAQAIGYIQGNGTNFFPKQHADRQAAVKLIYDITYLSDELIFNIFDVILRENGVEQIEEILFVDDNMIKIFQTRGRIKFFNIETGDILISDFFERPATDWERMTNQEKMTYVTELFEHWKTLEEIKVPETELDFSQVIANMDRYFQQGGMNDIYLYEVYRYILGTEHSIYFY